MIVISHLSELLFANPHKLLLLANLLSLITTIEEIMTNLKGGMPGRKKKFVKFHNFDWYKTSLMLIKIIIE